MEAGWWVAANIGLVVSSRGVGFIVTGLSVTVLAGECVALKTGLCVALSDGDVVKAWSLGCFVVFCSWGILVVAADGDIDDLGLGLVTGWSVVETGRVVISAIGIFVVETEGGIVETGCAVMEAGWWVAADVGLVVSSRGVGFIVTGLSVNLIETGFTFDTTGCKSGLFWLGFTAGFIVVVTGRDRGSSAGLGIGFVNVATGFTIALNGWIGFIAGCVGLWPGDLESGIVGFCNTFGFEGDLNAIEIGWFVSDKISILITGDFVIEADWGGFTIGFVTGFPADWGGFTIGLVTGFPADWGDFTIGLVTGFPAAGLATNDPCLAAGCVGFCPGDLESGIVGFCNTCGFEGDLNPVETGWFVSDKISISITGDFVFEADWGGFATGLITGFPAVGLTGWTRAGTVMVATLAGFGTGWVSFCGDGLVSDRAGFCGNCTAGLVINGAGFVTVVTGRIHVGDCFNGLSNSCVGLGIATGWIFWVAILLGDGNGWIGLGTGLVNVVEIGWRLVELLKLIGLDAVVISAAITHENCNAIMTRVNSIFFQWQKYNSFNKAISRSPKESTWKNWMFQSFEKGVLKNNSKKFSTAVETYSINSLMQRNDFKTTFIRSSVLDQPQL